MRRILLCVIMSLYFTAAPAQIVINEFSAANSTLIADPDNDDYADWIELYNTGTSAVNLKDFFITDDLKIPGKWKIGLDTIIPAGALPHHMGRWP